MTTRRIRGARKGAGWKAPPSPASRCSAPTPGSRAPETLPLEDLRRTLERLAGEIMVDLTLAEADPRP